MKFLFDQNLSHLLVARLQGLFPDSSHVRLLGLERASDEAVWEYATEKGRGEVLWPMRIALSGKEKSPDPFTIAEIIGQKETLARLYYAARLQ